MKPVPYSHLRTIVNQYLKNKISFATLINSINSKRMRRIFMFEVQQATGNPYHKNKTCKGYAKHLYMYAEFAIMCREKYKKETEPELF